MPMGLEPFDPKKHKPKDIGKGGLTTEYLITEYDSDGQVWNIPSVWWDDEGNPLEMKPELAQQLAADHEKQTGKRFPRFKSLGDGVAAAKKRSKRGGATKEPLAAGYK